MIRIPNSKKKKSPVKCSADSSENFETSDLYSEQERERKAVKKHAVRLTDCQGENANAPKQTVKHDAVSVSVETAEDNTRDKALSAAFRILQSGANSRKMLREKLLKKGFSENEAESAIEECEKLGFLSEKRLFSAHTAYLAEKKHFGKKRLMRELLKKFDRSTVTAYWEEAIEEIDFLQNARLEGEKAKARGKRYVFSRLQTLGYTANEIYTVLAALTFENEE